MSKHVEEGSTVYSDALRMADKGLLKHIHSKTVLRDNNAHYVLPDAFKGLTRNGDR